MAMQRTTEGRTGQHSYSREQAEPFAIKTLRETFESYPPEKQASIRADVLARLRDEVLHHEFSARIANTAGKRPGSALARLAGPVYGINIEDL